MITLNQLIILYKDIAARHEMVNDFEVAQDFNIGADDDINYPILVVNPTGANLPRTEGGYTSFRTTFELQVVDLVNKDNDNRLDVLSDTQQIINDVVNEFNTHPYYIDSGIDTIGDISFTPLRGVYNDDVDGWKITIELEHPNKLSFCGNPIENLSGFDFTPASVTVVDGLNQYELFPSQTYTCEVPTPPSGIEYQRTYRTLQSTSYALYDDGWQEANGGYNFAELTKPLYTQKLDFATDPTGVTLLYDNAFGNKFRYTYDDGTFMPFAVTNVYGIDNLTGLGHYFNTDLGTPSFDDTYGAGGLLEGYNNTSLQGYNDWFTANIRMLEVLGKNGGGDNLMYNCPYYGDSGVSQSINSSSISYISTRHRVYNKQVASANTLNTTSTFRILPTRIHFK